MERYMLHLKNSSDLNRKMAKDILRQSRILASGMNLILRDCRVSNPQEGNQQPSSYGVELPMQPSMNDAEFQEWKAPDRKFIPSDQAAKVQSLTNPTTTPTSIPTSIPTSTPTITPTITPRPLGSRDMAVCLVS